MATRIHYRILYHIGPTVDLKTTMLSGTADIDDAVLKIAGPKPLTIPLTEIRDVRLFRLHGTGRTISFSWNDKTIHVMVIRFHVFGRFALGNFLGNGRLFRRVRSSSQNWQA